MDDHGHLTMLLPQSFPRAFAEGFETAVEKVGCGQSTARHCLSPTTKTPDVIASVAAGIPKYGGLEHQIFVFLFLAAADVSFHPPAWAQELRARPPGKKKIFI